MKRFLVVVGGAILIALLAGGAFLAGRQLQAPASAAGQDSSPTGSGGSGNPVIMIDDGSGPVRITFTDPPEIPGPPDSLGIFLRRQDNSIFIGTGRIQVESEVVNGEATISAANDGPTVEVVVTGNTVLYEDITELPIIGPEDVERGEMVVPRVVKPVESLDGLGENMVLRVWGELRGDRIVATMLVYNAIR